MVTLNLTILIQLALFLIFLTVTHKLVLKPMLGVLDQRDEQVRQDEETATASAESAAQLEQKYAGEIGTARRDASVKMAQARRDAITERIDKVNEQRRQIEEEVAQVRLEAEAQLEAERAGFPALAESLAGSIEPKVLSKEAGK